MRFMIEAENDEERRLIPNPVELSGVQMFGLSASMIDESGKFVSRVQWVGPPFVVCGMLRALELSIRETRQTAIDSYDPERPPDGKIVSIPRIVRPE